MSDELKKMLEQAAEESVGKTFYKEELNTEQVDIVSEEHLALIERQTQLAKALEITESGKDKWDLLKEKMNGAYADRLMSEMDTLSGREFVRTYMKLLEYFKPKVIRVQNDSDEEEDDKVIRIEVFNSSQKQDETTIDITHKEE